MLSSDTPPRAAPPLTLPFSSPTTIAQKSLKTSTSLISQQKSRKRLHFSLTLVCSKDSKLSLMAHLVILSVFWGVCSFQEDGKAFYDELAREDKAEEEEFLDIVRRDAEEIKAARQVIKDARRLANTKATHLHRSVCPESADVEPPLSFHHQVWAREQQQMAKLAASHQGAPAMAQEPQLSDTTRDVDLSEVSSDSDSETESEDSDAEALPEATPQPLGQQCHPHHVHFNQRVESHSPPPSISVQAIPPSSVRRQSYRITPEVPSEAEARQTYRPASRDKNRECSLLRLCSRGH